MINSVHYWVIHCVQPVTWRYCFAMGRYSIVSFFSFYRGRKGRRLFYVTAGFMAAHLVECIESE